MSNSYSMCSVKPMQRIIHWMVVLLIKFILMEVFRQFCLMNWFGFPSAQKFYTFFWLCIMCMHNNKSFIGIVCENRIKIGKKCRQRNQFISILVRMFAEW